LKSADSLTGLLPVFDKTQGDFKNSALKRLWS